MGGCSADSGDSTGGSSDKTFRILAIMPLSGQLASIGGATQTAMKAAVNVINAEGGANGKQIEVKYVDDAGTPTQAVNVLQKELNSGTKYDFAFLGSTSGEAIPMVQAASQRKLLNCSQAASDALNKGATYPYFFGAATSASGTAAGVVNQVKQEGRKSVALLVADTELGASVNDAISADLGKEGIKFASQKLDPTATDATAQLEKLRAGNPDVLLLDAYGPSAAVMLASVKKLGWQIPVIGTADLAANDFASIPPASYEGITVNSISLNVTGTSVTTSPEFTVFRDAMIKESGGKLQFAAETYASAYSCVLLARAAADIAKSTDPEKMRTALESVKDASQVKGWFACPKIGFSESNRKPTFAPTDYVAAKPGQRKDMLLPSAS
ncbi:ABC transporter substrate-binding protein [Dactylosporangium salmoneum]